MSYEHVKNFRNNRKNQIVYVMGGKCQICGYDKSNSALELHHINPDEKEFTFDKGQNISWEKLQEELKKCILVCANCHREIHYENLDFKLFSSYDEDKANKITKEIEDLKSHKIFHCKNCGKIISNGAIYCKDCCDFKKRKADRPSREELKSLIRIYPFTVLSEKFGVSDNAIRKWCDSYNLPRKKKDIKEISDEDWNLI